MRRSTVIAAMFSALWIVGWCVYLRDYLATSTKALEPNTWGDFLAGAFAPLAFIWLIVGFFQQGVLLKQNADALEIQQKELETNNEILKLQHQELKASTEALTLQYEEMKKAAVQAAVQSEAIAANEQHARRDVLLRVLERMEIDLAQIASKMLREFEPGLADRTAVEFGAGLSGVYARELILFFRPDRMVGSVAHLYVHGGWPYPARVFCEHYERTIEQIRDLGAENELLDAFSLSPNAELVKRLKEVFSDLPDIFEHGSVHIGGNPGDVAAYLENNRKSRSK